jgi:integrase
MKTLRECSLATRQLQELKRGEVREALRDISRQRGAGSARKVKTLVRAAARWAAAEDMVPHDVLAGLSMPEIEPRRRDRVLSDEEIIALWRACDDAPPIMAASVRLQLLLALRHPSETAGMRWTDLHRNRIDQPRANCGNATVAPSSYPPPPRQALRRASGLAYVFALSEDTYMSKLTLSVDDDVVRRAKRYAAKRATSLSQLVERYLDLLSSRPQKAGKQDPPVLRMLRGAARGVKVEDYRRHVVEKYR